MNHGRRPVAKRSGGTSLDLAAAAAQIPRVAEIDDELMARVLQWCAEAGRPSNPAEVRDALATLSWDALLAVRATLADAPPARPLGPYALLEIARGVDPDAAARREREGVHARPGGPAAPPAAPPAPGAEPLVPAPPPRAETRRTRGKATRRIATVVIRRARDRQAEEVAVEPARPLVDELFHSEGRATIERWVRVHGARRARLVEELGAWRKPDGGAAGPDELSRLLDAHGLTRPFERREREEVLHALRAAGGRLAGAARALGVTPQALSDAIERLGIRRDVDRIRDERRDDIRRRATLGDRVRMLVDEAERLEDLGMTPEIEADVRDRLREHVKALRAGSGRHLSSSFARTLAITREQASAIAMRFGLDLRDADDRRDARPVERRDASRRPVERRDASRRPVERRGERVGASPRSPAAAGGPTGRGAPRRGGKPGAPYRGGKPSAPRRGGKPGESPRPRKPPRR